MTKKSEAQSRAVAPRLPDRTPQELRAGDSAGAGSRRSRRPALLQSPLRSGHTAATLILEKGQVLSLRLSGRPFRVACVSGRLWATVDRSPTDYLLVPGEAHTFRGRGTVVIQALRTATAHIEQGWTLSRPPLPRYLEGVPRRQPCPTAN